MHCQQNIEKRAEVHVLLLVFHQTMFRYIVCHQELYTAVTKVNVYHHYHWDGWFARCEMGVAVYRATVVDFRRVPGFALRIT